MEQAWVEMKKLIKKKFAKAVWLPLRAVQTVFAEGQWGHLGFRKEYFGAGSILAPTFEKASVEKLGWGDIGVSHDQGPYIQDDSYISSEIYEHYNFKVNGLHLVLQQRSIPGETTQWHLHQDFVLAFRLKRETDSRGRDVWVCPEEDYTAVARLQRDEYGSPVLMEVRAEYLRDYMCARGMGLYITSYRERTEVVQDVAHIQWKDNPETIESPGVRWEGRKYAIHEGGHLFGSEMHVTHMSRTDVDPDEDVPTFDFPKPDEIESRSGTVQREGDKLYRITGELWKNEWIEPGQQSPRIRGDKLSPTVFFVVDAAGNQESRETLKGEGRWLWFRPEVVATLAHRRGGSLGWHTRDTGRIACSHGHGVPFGVNKLGFITVYAKDIALLPDWQQKIWAGYNVGPEGKVSEELLASQMRARPAKTQAPEKFLSEAIEELNKTFQKRFGLPLFRKHQAQESILSQTHRFRATDQAGLFSLAKDLTRLTAESMSEAALKKTVRPPPEKRWRSLRLLEEVLARDIEADRARSLLTPLVGIYELRLDDAHLPSQDINEALKKAGVNKEQPPVFQGHSLLYSCVSSLRSIAKVLEGHDEDPGLQKLESTIDDSDKGRQRTGLKSEESPGGGDAATVAVKG